MGLTMRLAVLLVAVLAGCATLSPEQKHAEEMLTAASALTKVAAAAEASVRYGNPPENMSDAEFLQFATAHDPALLQPFATYQLKSLRQERHAVILLCSADGAAALVEDAGCTAQVDRHHWKLTPPPSCNFTLEPRLICQGPLSGSDSLANAPLLNCARRERQFCLGASDVNHPFANSGFLQ